MSLPVSEVSRTILSRPLAAASVSLTSRAAAAFPLPLNTKLKLGFDNFSIQHWGGRHRNCWTTRRH
jgi:hypothetical protein